MREYAYDKKQPANDQCFDSDNSVPFESVEQAWFWFITAQKAISEGARISAGVSNIHRPCEPIDILRCIDSLYRKRRLIKDHILVLRHYGMRYLPPDPYRVREARAASLWREAMERLEEVLCKKGIVREKSYTGGLFS